MDVRDILALSPVVPVMVVHDLDSIADAAMALFAGGIRAFEITLRTPQALQAEPGGPLDLWFCGPQGLGDALHAHARGPRRWRLHRESFAMR